MDARTALKTGIAKLRDANVPFFTLAAELLLLHVAGRNRTWLYAHPEDNLLERQEELFFELIARRITGEPTQYLTGKQEFWGLEFEVNPAVLIPRPETEHVIEVALDRLALREVRAGRPQKSIGEGLQIADIGTGSGCIAVALAKELPAARITATDISRSALEVAGRNADRHNVADHINFVESNLLDKLNETTRDPSAQSLVRGHQSPLFDLVASNPPYVGRREATTLALEVRDHEPHTALFGGEEGYELYGELIAQAAKHVRPGGILVLELGHDSLAAVQPLVEADNWMHVGVTNDLAGIPRVIAAERK
jgi:release factor glutamine methyltransferase